MSENKRTLQIEINPGKWTSLKGKANYEGQLRAKVEHFKAFLEGKEGGSTSTAKDYKRLDERIRKSLEVRAGDYGMCGGIIDSGYYTPDQGASEAFLISVDMPGQHHPERGPKRFSGFAACKFVPVHKKLPPALYIDILCANRPGVAKYIMQTIICQIGKSLIEAGAISAIQLSSLTYVIGYYYKQWNFRFYTFNDEGHFIPDAKVNGLVPTLPRIGADLEYQHDLDGLIEEGATKWEEIRATAASQKAGHALLAKLTKLQNSKRGRKATLTERLHVVQQIYNLDTKLPARLRTLRDFMEIAAPHSIAKPAFKIHNLRGQERQEAQLAAVDPAGEGWKMFAVPDAIAALCKKLPTEARAARSARRRVRKHKKKTSRRKKGTRKRALKKRHRRRKKTQRLRRRRRRKRRGVTRRRRAWRA